MKEEEVESAVRVCVCTSVCMLAFSLHARVCVFFSSVSCVSLRFFVSSNTFSQCAAAKAGKWNQKDTSFVLDPFIFSVAEKRTVK